VCTETVKYNIYWDIDFCKFQGTLMLSEFTACSHVIPGALRTNPWREEECARVIIKSLRQPAHERQHWQEQQLAWYYIVKRDLLQCQKRPITYRDLLHTAHERQHWQEQQLAWYHLLHLK
jgi:trehalose-6-phosphate synthase